MFRILVGISSTENYFNYLIFIYFLTKKIISDTRSDTRKYAPFIVTFCNEFNESH